MANPTDNSFPWKSDGLYVFDNIKVDGVLVPASGVGSWTNGQVVGSITWRHADGTSIAGQAWPANLTWNATLKRVESIISKDCDTTLGELVSGERIVTAPNGKVGRDLVKIRVRAPSSVI